MKKITLTKSEQDYRFIVCFLFEVFGKFYSVYILEFCMFNVSKVKPKQLV